MITKRKVQFYDHRCGIQAALCKREYIFLTEMDCYQCKFQNINHSMSVVDH